MFKTLVTEERFCSYVNIEYTNIKDHKKKQNLYMTKPSN